MNEHKFYKEYVLPVLEEIKEELKKRGKDCYIVGKQLHNDGNLLVSYDFEICQFHVDRTIQHLFSNDFDYTFNTTTELIFKPIPPNSIYALKDGDVAYYINAFGDCAKYIRCEEDGEGYRSYRKMLESKSLYLTEEDCKRDILRTKAIAKIEERAYELQGDWKPNWADKGEDRLYIAYDCSEKELMVTGTYWLKYTDIAFKTAEIAWHIIDELPEECKLMLEVEVEVE